MWLKGLWQCLLRWHLLWFIANGIIVVCLILVNIQMTCISLVCFVPCSYIQMWRFMFLVCGQNMAEVLFHVHENKKGAEVRMMHEAEVRFIKAAVY